MVSSTNIDLLVAKYLQTHKYEKALNAFQEEIGDINLDVDSNYKSLEEIVDEHERFFISSSHSTTIKTKSSISASLLKHKWNKNHPKIPKEFPIPNNIKPSLIITLFIGDLLIDNAFIKVLITSTSDQYLRIYDFEDNELIVETKILHSSAIRVINIIEKKYIITGGLDGQLILSKINTQKNGFNLKPIILKINKIKAHSRFILEIDYKNGFLISIGHDNYLCLFKFNDDKLNNEKLKKIASYKLLTTPTSIRITNYTGFPIIVLTRSESTCLFFYKLSHNDNDKENEQFKIIEIKKINLNESQYSTTNDFTPMNIKLCPINKNNDNNDLLIAVATSHVPFMRILLIKFPFLKFDEENIIEDSNLNSLNKNDNNNDDEYILGNFQTNSPQDNFSIPRITWRSDGNGIWVAGDDGIIRGIDISSDQIYELKSHTDRIREVFTTLDEETKKEVLVSGSVDKKIIFWE